MAERPSEADKGAATCRIQERDDLGVSGRRRREDAGEEG